MYHAQDMLVHKQKESRYLKRPQVDLLQPFDQVIREKRLEGAIGAFKTTITMHLCMYTW